MDTIQDAVARHVAADPGAHAALVFDLEHVHAGATTRPIDPVVVDRHLPRTMAAVAEIARGLPPGLAGATPAIIAHLADHAHGASNGAPRSAAFMIGRTLFAVAAAARASAAA